MNKKLSNIPLMMNREFLDNGSSYSGHQTEGYTVNGSHAVIQIKGALKNELNIFDEIFGSSTSYSQIKSMIEQVLLDSSVESYTVVIDTGGGEATGAVELADWIYSVRDEKPNEAHIKGMCASAGYLIGSQFQKLLVSKTSSVGSIGVIASFVDNTKKLENEGLSVEYIYAGDRKIDGREGLSLTDDAKAQIQEKVDQHYMMMVSSIARARGVSEQAIKDTQAATFLGQKAIDIGLADGLLRPPEAIINTKEREVLTAMSKGPKESDEIDLATIQKEARADALAQVREIEASAKGNKAAYDLGISLLDDGLNIDRIKEHMSRCPSPIVEKENDKQQEAQLSEKPVDTLREEMNKMDLKGPGPNHEVSAFLTEAEERIANQIGLSEEDKKTLAEQKELVDWGMVGAVSL